MDQKNNKEPEIEAEKETEKEASSERELEELEELIESLKKLEEERNLREKQNNNKPSILTIEFGGVYHTNILVNFLFQLVLNITLAYLVIQVFQFAEFKDIYMYLLFIGVYTVIESILKTYITIKFFKYIIQSMGFILYLTYLILFFVLDVFVFKNTFTFTHEYHIVAFVTMFIILRYFVGTWIKRYLRSKMVR
jgi:hypothetical protein